MASKPGKTAAAAPAAENDPKVLRRINTNSLKKVWGEISLPDWLNLLKVVDKRSNQWVIHGDKVMGLCPFHPEAKPSFTIDTVKKYAKCFGCQRFFWNPFQFYAEFKSTAGGVTTTYIEAVKELKDRFDLKLPNKAIAVLSKRWRSRLMKKFLHQVTNKELVAALNGPIDARYSYAQKTIRYLDHRNVPHIYDQLPIGVRPPELHLETGFKAAATAAGHDAEELWTLAKTYLEDPYLSDQAWQGALMFYSGDNPNEPCAIKLRKVPEQIFVAPTPVVSDMFGSTATAAPAVDKDMRWVKDELEEGHGLFGLYGTPIYAVHLAPQDVKSFVLVEGEFDALALIAKQCEKRDIGCLVFGGGGGDVPSLDFMHEFGFETAYVVGDHDAGGDKFIQAALERTVKLNMRVFVWPDALLTPGQEKLDPDEAVQKHGYAKVQDEFRRPESYLLPYRWASTHALLEMVGTDPQDVRTLTNKGAKWGQYVHDTAERREFINVLQQQHPTINTGVLYSKICATEEHEEAFIERIKGVFQARLCVMNLFHDKTATILRVYDKKTEQLYDFKLNDIKQIIATVQSMVGCDAYKFIREEVGEPTFLPSYEEKLSENQPFYFDQLNKMSQYIAIAVTNLMETLPRASDIRYLGPSFHMPRRQGKDGVEEKFGYLVNGMTLYRRSYDEGEESIWRRCNGPADRNVIIYAEPDQQPKLVYPQLDSETALNEPVTTTFPEMYKKIYDVLYTGWDFVHHELTCHLITAFLMSLYITDIFSRQPVIMVTAEHSSGKSQLVGGLIGRTTKPSINIIQAALFTDNYTKAGVKNAMNHSRLCLCLDEFEDRGLPNDPKSRQVTGVLEILRGQANEGGSTLQAAGANGRVIQYETRFPAIAAGIRSVTLPEDLSRFIFVELNKKEDRTSPEVAILEKFSKEYLAGIRDELPRLMFNHVAELLAANAEIADRYKHGADVEFGKISRSREQYYGILSVMKLAGHDYDQWLKDHFKANRGFLERVSQASLSGDIFRTLISVPNIRVVSVDMTPQPNKTINTILSSEHPGDLNGSGVGVYYDFDEGNIVVDWGMVKYSLLRDTEWFYKTPDAIKQLAARNRYHISDDVVRLSGVLERLAPFMGKGTPLSHISVFNVQDLLMEAQESRKALRVNVDETLDVAAEFAAEIAQASFPAPSSISKGGKGQPKKPGKPNKVGGDDWNY